LACGTIGAEVFMMEETVGALSRARKLKLETFARQCCMECGSGDGSWHYHDWIALLSICQSAIERSLRIRALATAALALTPGNETV